MPTSVGYLTSNSVDVVPTSYSIQDKEQDYMMSFTQPIEEWPCESVARWLSINDLSVYSDTFVEKGIDGEKLIGLDSTKLKVIIN